MSKSDLSDQDFIYQFENLQLEKQYFNHVGHLRLAWFYIQTYDYDMAEKKTLNGIKTYATHLGANEKFHYTLTKAIMLLIKDRMSCVKRPSFKEFRIQNSDLLDNMQSIIHTYYSKNLLNSTRAKEEFILPDLQPLPGSL